MSRLLLIGVLSFLPGVQEQEAPGLRRIDRVRLAEAYRLAETFGDRVWEGWSEVPFAILLVAPEHEFLIGHPQPSDDFAPLGHDELLERDVWWRGRTHATGLLATFPAVGGVSTVVIGQAENTSVPTSTPWVLTLLHEHFHQLQNAQPDYYSGVNALGLAKGDTSGMWMLNYAFPYDDPEVGELHAARCAALADALAARKRPEFPEKFADYLGARAELRAHLEPDDAKYLAFQVWQEGVARYTEVRLAELAATGYEPSEAFRELDDYTSFEAETRAHLGRIESELRAGDLAALGRVAIYSLGAAEALVLDRASPQWRQGYLEHRFSLDAHFD